MYFEANSTVNARLSESWLRDTYFLRSPALSEHKADHKKRPVPLIQSTFNELAQIIKSSKMVSKSKGDNSASSRPYRSVGLTKRGALPPLSPGAPGSGSPKCSPKFSKLSSTREKRTPPPSSEESVANVSVKTTETDLSRRQKQLEHTILDVSDEFICPLSKELMVDPVLAEDGNMYERQDLERYIISKAKSGFALKSPVTGEPMGSTIRNAATVKNTISKLVSSGAINIENSARWKNKFKTDHLVERMRQKAAEGNGNAMYNLGVWHQFGRFGFKKDHAKAYSWYVKAADKGDPCGKANAGCCLIWGLGTPPNQLFGMHLLTSAANSENGSDFACKTLADMFDKGMLGMPQDDKKARYYYVKALEGDPKHRQLTPEEREKIAKKLRILSKKIKARSPGHSKSPSIGESVANWMGITQCVTPLE